ncbi:hypothetical protein HUW63_14945 [Myxococcus sp. AM001]|nr:hypothetical protein [Myxococcus sp. AM001]
MRVVIPILVSALLTTACGTEATGECQGTHLGATVKWPIDGEMSRWNRDGYSRNGVRGTWIDLSYDPKGAAGLVRFGVDIRLVDGAVVGGSPVTVALSNEDAQRLVPAADSLVVDWLVNVATRSTTGFPETTGVPVGGSVTFDAVNEDFAAGRYVYHYRDGSELTCTFNVPSPEHAAGFLGGDYEDDDDDDD